MFLSAVLTAQPLVDADVLEPSVLNEVQHALSLAPTNAVSLTPASAAFAAFYATNGMNATSRAISLVSAQKDGRWFHNGHDVTPVAVLFLRALADPGELELPPPAATGDQASASCAAVQPCCGTNSCACTTE